MKSNKNNHYLKLPFIILVIFVFINFNGNAQEQEQAFKPSGKIWGLMFGDVFYKAAGDTLAFGRSEYAKEPTESLGAKLRRVYFGYDFNISPRWSTRFLLEGTSSTTLPQGNFGVVIKLGYLQYNDVFKFIPNSKLRMGLIPTPLFAFPEKVWGYRSVEKEALDLRGFGNSSDQGASLEGNFDKNGNSGFTAMIGNGSGNKPIANKYLEYYLSVHKRFFDKKLNVELMMDYKRLNTEQERILFRTFGSYELPNFRFGVEISPNSFDQTVKIGTESQVVQTKPFLGSTFAAAKLHKIVWLFARWDYLNPDTNYNAQYQYPVFEQNYDENLFITGLQIIVNEKVNITPNLYINTYDRKNVNVPERDPDVVLRTTVYFQF